MQGPLRSTSSTTFTAFIEVADFGLYRVSYEDLAGLNLEGTDPQYLRLLQGNEEVSCEWEGDTDTAFEPGEALLFYAEPRFSRWTEIDAYKLVVGSTPGLRMETRSADPAGLSAGAPWVEQVAEENHLYMPDCFCGPLPSGRDGDRWAWKQFRRPDLISETLSFRMPAVDPTRPATLTLWLVGYTDVAGSPDHRVDVALNDAALGQVEWDGKTAVTATLAIPIGRLHAGDNNLSLALPGIPGLSTEGMWLDGFVVHYALLATVQGAAFCFGGEPGRHAYTLSMSDTSDLHAYDVTDPLRPERLSGVQVNENMLILGDPAEGDPRHYMVASESGVLHPAMVRAPVNPWVSSGAKDPGGADVLVITHPVFETVLGPLVGFRRAQGFSVALANVLGIYDVWGDGRPDPETLRTFIADVYNSSNPRPTHVLLVGDGSFDPRRYQPQSPPTFIPPYLADVDPWAGETAADNRYVCVDGSDTLPDLLLGRLPVKTVEEAREVVEKIIDYETTPLPGEWNSDVILVADDPDWAGDFIASSEAHAAVYVSAPFTVTRHYCSGSSPYLSDCNIQEADDLRDTLVSDWNGGALLIQFNGHSSWHQWAVEGFFHISDTVVLRNDRRLPVVVEMTCFTGAFQRPEPTLDEGLVKRAGGGVVAAWGPTGLGVSTGHSDLSDGFFRAVFEQEVRTVGEGVLAGKAALATSGQHLDLLDTFNLIGDPCLELNRTLVPWTARVFLPLITLLSASR